MQMNRETQSHVCGDVLNYCMMQPTLYNRSFICSKNRRNYPNVKEKQV